MRALQAVGCVMLMPCLIPVGIGKIVLRKVRRKKAKWKNDVRPLPSRRNSLSIEPPSPPSPQPSWAPKTTIKTKTKIPPNPQLDCALLSRLPLELRLEIYGYVFGGPVVHLIQIPRRIAHTRCRLPTTCASRKCRPATRIPLHPQLRTIATANVALLKTCRRVYTEAAHVLYAANTFDVNHLNTFLSFCHTILPSRLAAITSLHLNWPTLDLAFGSINTDCFTQWWLCWDNIACWLRSLRDLKLCMGTGTVLLLQAPWVGPLCKVGPLRRFELEMPGPEELGKKEMAALKVVERRLTVLMTRSG
ncbi:hypothetical protein MMC07_008678 [Pseudocyphellaria aurata]|nr:hypothetical protein [Pseudocyphellaria aurata]